MKTINGNLLTLALQGEFDAIVHGCNCKNIMGAGIAGQIARMFPSAPQIDGEYMKDQPDYMKLGNYSVATVDQYLDPDNQTAITGRFDLINAYTQYMPGPDLDYVALQLVLRKINKVYKGKKIGLPQIGCGIAGGNWSIVSKWIQAELYECDVTVVIFDPKK